VTPFSLVEGNSLEKVILPSCLRWKCCSVIPFSLVELISLTKDRAASMFRVEMIFSDTV